MTTTYPTEAVRDRQTVFSGRTLLTSSRCRVRWSSHRILNAPSIVRLGVLIRSTEYRRPNTPDVFCSAYVPTQVERVRSTEPSANLRRWRRWHSDCQRQLWRDMPRRWHSPTSLCHSQRDCCHSSALMFPSTSGLGVGIGLMGSIGLMRLIGRRGVMGLMRHRCLHRTHGWGGLFRCCKRARVIRSRRPPCFTKSCSSRRSCWSSR